MTHDERMQLGHDLCERMVGRHGSELLIGGIYGSTARYTDTPWSDLEMLFILKGDGAVQEKHFIYQGLALGYHTLGSLRLEEILTHPSVEWPFWTGVLSVLRVLHGDQRLIHDWLSMAREAPADKFRDALVTCLPQLVVESYGRIRSCALRGNTDDLYCAVIEVLLEMNRALCLLNHRWVTHDYYGGLVEAFAFPKLPQEYHELAPRLWRSRDMDEIVFLADQLVANFWRLVSEEGIEAPVFRAVADLPLG